DQNGIPGDVVVVIRNHGVAGNNASHLVGDHVKALLHCVREAGPVLLCLKGAHQLLCAASMVGVLTVRSLSLLEDLSSVSHRSVLPSFLITLKCRVVSALTKRRTSLQSSGYSFFSAISRAANFVRSMMGVA